MIPTLIRNVRIASMQKNGKPFGELTENCLRIHGTTISELGTDFTPQHGERVIEGNGMWCLPGFIDCHTHLVYGGNRANEFALRQQGVDYQTISAQGGGIKSTVRATREASHDALVTSGLRRARRLLEEGVTTVEIKSGYGLDKDTEVRMLNAATDIASTLGIAVQRTFLGAHALPPDSTMSADEYIDFVTLTMIPYIAEHQLADAVDVFCETVGFNLAQTERVFMAAKEANLPVKGHVEQLSDSKGACLAARYHALSVDHIEYLAPEDVGKLKDAGTVAVLLPGAFYYLKEKQLPPIAALRAHNVPMAIASDINPGTSPLMSLLTCANMASVQFGLTTQEALEGMTIHAAQALGLKNKGQIGVGFDADISLWNISSPDEIVYEINGYRPEAVWCGGKHVL